MSAMQPAKPPTSALGRHRILSPSAGVLVSPICLGTMNFGHAWAQMLGECSKETAFEILDYFYSQGGNFLDTAGSYQAGDSETWVGEWMARRDVRDDMVIATKYTAPWRHLNEPQRIQSNYGGNNTKSMHVAIETSLKRLQTSYVDILYVHYWDQTTPIPEVMQSLNHLVASGKVLYLGISDTPAWIVAKCNAYAREHGLRPFSLYQGKWSAAERDFEREIIPMCMDDGMALAPWGALGGGYFKTAAQLAEKKGGRNLQMTVSKHAEAVALVLDKMASRKGTLITSIALAYVMHKTPYVFPICGGRMVSHLKGNIEALSLKLSDEDIAEIETAYDFDVGFPHNFLAMANVAPKGPGDIALSRRLGHFDHVQKPLPIAPHQEQ